MPELTDELRRAIEHDCLMTFNRYMVNVDKHIDRFTETFTEDVVWTRPSGTMRGHGEMQAFMNKYVQDLLDGNPPHGHLSRHMVTTSHIEVRDAENADGTFVALVIRDDQFDGNLPALMPTIDLVVDYTSSFRKTPTGWRISRHHAQHIFRR